MKKFLNLLFDESEAAKQILEMIYSNQQRDLRERELEETFQEVEI